MLHAQRSQKTKVKIVITISLHFKKNVTQPAVWVVFWFSYAAGSGARRRRIFLDSGESHDLSACQWLSDINVSITEPLRQLNPVS